MFLRGRPGLATKMKRMKHKGTGPRKPALPHTEPDFYQMAPVNTRDNAVGAVYNQEMLTALEGCGQNNTGELGPSEEVACYQVPEEDTPWEWDESRITLSQFDDCDSDISALTCEDATVASPSRDPIKSFNSYNEVTSLLDDLILDKPSSLDVTPPATLQNEETTTIEGEEKPSSGTLNCSWNINLADFLTRYYQEYGVPKILWHEVTPSASQIEESDASAPSPTPSSGKFIDGSREDTRCGSLGLDGLDLSTNAGKSDTRHPDLGTIDESYPLMVQVISDSAQNCSNFIQYTPVHQAPAIMKTLETPVLREPWATR